MNEFIYTAAVTPASKKYDVIVVGGGTAGAAAAIAAAKFGARTLLVEKYSSLGGSSTNGLVTPMMHTGIPGNPDSSLVNKELKKRLAREGACFGAEEAYGNDGWINPEMLKFVLEEMQTESGGELLYNTEFVDAAVGNSRVEGILVHNTAGLQMYRATYYIDCTADACLAKACGVECFAGDEKQHKNQAMSLRFMAGGVDIERLSSFLLRIGEELPLKPPLFEMASMWKYSTPLSDLFRKALDDGAIQYEDGAYFQAFSVPGMPGVIDFNCPEIPDSYDALDPSAISAALVKGRTMIRRLMAFLQNYMEGFEHSFIFSVASMPGVRESRRIRGKYVLSEQDYENRAKFEDAVAQTAYPVDIHGETGADGPVPGKMKDGEFMEVPFRCLVPEKIRNLLVAGRCISSTFTVQSAIRIQPTCRATGEAAGLAAAYCAKNGTELADLDGATVRNIMKNLGAAL